MRLGLDGKVALVTAYGDIGLTLLPKVKELQ
jgi:hypothetical protein